jgi:hypothetical protein
MFKRDKRKKQIKEYIDTVKKTPKQFLRVKRLQLIVFINKEVPEEDQKHHLSEVLTSWTLSNSMLKNTQTWYNQRANREDNIIIYGVDTDMLKNIINQPDSKTLSYIGELPIAACLGLRFDNENHFNYERMN